MQRKTGSYAPPAPPVPPNPRGDPRFTKVSGELKKTAKTTKAHPPGRAEAKKASDAAVPPANDKQAQAKAGQADKMAGAKKGGFDKAAFIAAVKQAIAAAAPKTLEDADKFADSGKAAAVKDQVMSKVDKGKDDSAKDVAEKTKEAPDPSKATDKPVKPLEQEKEAKPKAPEFAKAMPAKVPPEQTDFDGPKNEVNDQMAEADVSESDLKKSNEPQMMGAVEAKKEGDAQSAQAPKDIRAKEAEVLKKAQADADQKGKGGIDAMAGAKKNALTQAAAKKSDQKSKDEAKRAEIAAELNKIFDKTKVDVEKILTELDGKVDDAFTKGEADVRKAFTAEHKRELEAFKERRYAGFDGKVQWGIDLFKDLSEVPEVKQIYQRAKANYEKGMERVISNVADVVGREIDRAKERIAAGRLQIKDWVAKQPKEVQKLAADAAKGMDEKFNQLESDVDAKSESLASDLAGKYTAALGEVNKEIEEAQAANKSAWSKAKAAIGESIEAILKLKDLFMGMLAKAAGAFKKILADPLKFIGNFMSAVKAGFLAFADRIGEHLKKGLQSWLFGKLADAGIEIPDKLDLQGIIRMVLSILGLTWATIRPKLVKVVGEKAMSFLESKAEVFMILVKEGVGGLWKWIVDKVGDLKEMVMGQIRDFVITKIVKAGITWVIGMLNPAGALIKIIQTLINVIQWIMEKGAALVELVGTIIDSVSDIANGGMGGVPAKIEGALAKAVPIVISFLASLLGLGGIGEKIKSILDSVRGPVGRAVDAVIAGALKLGKKLIAGVKGLGKKAGKAIKDAVQWVARIVMPPPVVKPFTLASGESHTATMTPNASGAKVTLASAFAGEAKTVLNKAKQEATNPADKQAIAAALAAVKACEDAAKEWATEKKAAEKAAKARIARWVAKADDPAKTWPADRRQREFERLVAEKEARKYRTAEAKIGEVVMKLKHLKSLDKLTDKSIVKKRQLPAGYDIRANLYERGSGWKTKSRDISEKQLDAIVKKVTQAKALGIDNGRPIIESLVKKKKVAANAVSAWNSGRFGPKSVLNTKYDLDHVVPLAKHWKSSGSKSGDQARWDHCVNPSNLNLITRAENTSKQAEGAAFGQKFYVETSFTSMFADGGVQNAKRIDGRPFKDMDTGKELA